MGLFTEINATSPKSTDAEMKVASYPAGYNINNTYIIASVLLTTSDSRYKCQNKNYNIYLKSDGIYMYIDATAPEDANRPCKLLLFCQH